MRDIQVFLLPTQALVQHSECYYFDVTPEPSILSRVANSIANSLANALLRIMRRSLAITVANTIYFADPEPHYPFKVQSTMHIKLVLRHTTSHYYRSWAVEGIISHHQNHFQGFHTAHL